MVGGTLVGYFSQVFGRRISIIVVSIVGGLLLYPYSFTANNGIIAAAFFEQFCVQGAWVDSTKWFQVPANKYRVSFLSI